MGNVQMLFMLLLKRNVFPWIMHSGENFPFKKNIVINYVWIQVWPNFITTTIKNYIVNDFNSKDFGCKWESLNGVTLIVSDLQVVKVATLRKWG